MNDPNKKIEIDKSSLLSLKAELLRKQAEVSKAKAFSSIDDFVPKKVPKPIKEEKIEASGSKVTEIEDSVALTRSKQILEAKAKYYDRMVAAGGSLNSDENCLVMFNEKKQTVRRKSTSSESSVSDYDDDKYPSKHPDDEWVEYIDSLGRTRKCLKKDLDHFQRRDRALSVAMSSQRKDDDDSRRDDDNIDDDDEVIGPMPTPVKDENLEAGFVQIKEQWAQQEQENVQKEFVHYSDVLFNEARTHGVGFYEFSTDSEERAKQMEELNKMREATLEKQKEKENLRNARDKVIADRVKAAKARQRARLGLPPEEEAEEKKEEEELYDKTEEIERQRKEEKQKRKKEKEEKKREKERLRHVRPWDEGKGDDTEWNPKIQREPMSQQQWNEKKREERNKEFAPVAEKLHKKNEYKPRDPEPELEPESEPEKYCMDTRGNPQEMEDDYLPIETNKSLFFTSKKKEFKRRNYDSLNQDASSSSKKPKQVPVRIRNELVESSSSDEDDLRTRTAIPPPQNYEESGWKKDKKPQTKTDLEKSIEAGLQYLRNQSDKAGPSTTTKNKWTTNADY